MINACLNGVAFWLTGPAGDGPSNQSAVAMATALLKSRSTRQECYAVHFSNCQMNDKAAASRPCKGRVEALNHPTLCITEWSLNRPASESQTAHMFGIKLLLTRKALFFLK